jgi:hypothetical protein
MKQTDVELKKIVEELVKLTTQLTTEVAELVRRTEIHPGPFGDNRPRPIATERANALLLKASEIRQLCSEDGDSPAAKETT